jgi:hypothetical protein
VVTVSGTPLSAAARAAAMSPCPSLVASPVIPIGAMNSGEEKLIPNSSTDKSRTRVSTIIRGIMPQSAKALALRRWVASSPHPPWT